MSKEDVKIITLKENDKIGENGIIFENINNEEVYFEIIETPGHSRGDICYYDKKNEILFSGDTLFAGTYGRVDLPTSDPIQMGKSLKKLLNLNPEINVYPWNGFDTVIEVEKRYY